MWHILLNESVKTAGDLTAWNQSQSVSVAGGERTSRQNALPACLPGKRVNKWPRKGTSADNSEGNE